MKTILKNAKVVNVFTDEIEDVDIIFDEHSILGVGNYKEEIADKVIDVTGKYVCPGFIDGHIHLESSMLTPHGFAALAIAHGTTAVAADPHEIANVCGALGIEYMLEASENLPMDIYFTLPSCVPCSVYEENGAILEASDLEPFYKHPRVIGLGEMMDYMGVVSGNPVALKKIEDAKNHNKIINGHAPLLTAKDLDCYISKGIQDDHECSNVEEAKEKIKKGQWLMIRQGTAAQNLMDLTELFQEPWSRRCLFVTDDRQPSDLLKKGHIDEIIREAVASGCPVTTAIRMATIQAAQCLRLPYTGAIAPGYEPNFVVLDHLEEVRVHSVFYQGEKVYDTEESCKQMEQDFLKGYQKYDPLLHSFHLKTLSETDFIIPKQQGKVPVIQLIHNQLITNEKLCELDFLNGNGISIKEDILKLAVIERHKNTGHIGLGFITGFGMKEGAIASSIAHDSHNIMVLGTNEQDMAIAANQIAKMGGGLAVVTMGTVLVVLSLPVAGLMSEEDGYDVAILHEEVIEAAYQLGITREIDPFMSLAFVSLPVIPKLKLTTKGLLDVESQSIRISDNNYR